jgi:mRNA-degrading endonuclease RelE of RelBE toxin-antitoxin system
MRVEAFVKAQAPEPRRRLTRAIQGLAKNRGDIKRLEGALAEYSRLRIGGCRVIFAERSEAGERMIDCMFAERRAVVYEIFEALLAEELGR